MKKKSLKKFESKVKTISNLQNEVSGGRYSPAGNHSYEHTLCCTGNTEN
jgi:hypothetical protein